MKILIVEDDQRLAKNLKKGLQMKFHVVDLAYDGLEGYDFAVAEEYDVIVLDWMLPEMDGVKLCKKLRTEGTTTPILMLTARAQLGDKVEGLDAGADDYLGKPFEFAELLARIRALARRPRDTVINELRVADLTLNPTTYVVRRDGRELKLSKKEFALLEFLLRHPGQVFSKEQLVERVWDWNAEVLPNTAQVYIGYLREKIDRAFPDKPNLIETVRGFGYRIKAASNHQHLTTNT